MTNANEDRLGRRTFLKQMATVAGTRAARAGAHRRHRGFSPDRAGPPKEATDHETERLAAYAAALRYEDLPPAVVQRAKDCIIDAVADHQLRRRTAVEQDGHRLCATLWRRAARARSSAPAGSSVSAPAAALANGALAHAFELDCHHRAEQRHASGGDPVHLRARGRAGARPAAAATSSPPSWPAPR